MSKATNANILTGLAGLALIILGTAGAVLGWNYYNDITSRSALAAPARLETPNRAMLEEGAALLLLKSISSNEYSIWPELWMADREPFIDHVRNIAIAMGWIPHSESWSGESIEVILPQKDLDLLLSAENGPYGWVLGYTGMRGRGKLATWDSPAYVRVGTRPDDWSKAKGAALGGTVAGIVAAISIGVVAFCIVCLLKEGSES